MNKKNRRDRRAGLRWDKIFGLAALVSVLILIVMIYVDYGDAVRRLMSRNTKVSGSVKDDFKDTDGTAPSDKNTDITVAHNTTVCIDAGHGGQDVGAEYNGAYEKIHTLEVAELVQKSLEDRGINVVMTRTSDVTISNEERVRMCNAAGSVVLVSIHRNDYKGSKSVSGVECWIHSSAPSNSKQLSQNILNNLAKQGAESRGVRSGTVENAGTNYYVNTHSKCASCIVELGFMSSKKDTALVTTDKAQTAASIADGIIKYLEQAGYLNGSN